MASLKRKNSIGIAAVMAANAILFWGTTVLDYIETLPRDLLSPAAALAVPILVGVINGLASAGVKERLVFLRWRSPLPGSRAFSKYQYRDPRVDPAKISRIVDPLPTDPIEQNRAWYGLYRKVRDAVSVLEVHQSYLFARDYCFVSAMFLIGGLAYWLVEQNSEFLWIFLIIIVPQFLASGQAARVYGVRFVQTVLAEVQDGAP